MTCRHYQRLLSPYLDHELTAPEREQLLAHLSQCSDCGKRFQELENNRQLLLTLPQADITAAMTARLWQRLQKHETARENAPFSVASRLTPCVSRLTSRWRNWGMVSVGTLATAAAAIVLYVSTLQGPAEVSAEEVVSSMTQLLEELDPEEGAVILKEETPEEHLPDWRDDFDVWFSDDDEQN